MGRKAKTHEEFVAEVNALFGDEYTIVGTYQHSAVKIEVRHNSCGNLYKVRPDNFVRRLCPKCARKKTHEEFVREVYALVGDEYTVVGTYEGSRKKVLMKHNSCGNEWEARAVGFINTGRRCPECKWNVLKTTEKFKEDVHEVVGSEYVVLGEYVHSHDKILMKHRTCGFEYEVAPNNFLNKGSRCIVCLESKGEATIAKFLDSQNIEYDREFSIKYAKSKRPLRLDFLVGNVAIEYDGELHYKAIKHFGGEDSLTETQRRDRIKDKYCADNGIPLIRIPYWDFDNIDAILTEKLLPLLDASSTQKQAS